MKRPSYSTDLTNAQWKLIEPLIPSAKPGGRPRTTDLREILNAIFYLLRTGCQWRLLPHDLPPWGTVHYYYWTWRKDGTWQKIHHALREKLRKAQGKEETPSVGILDSQSVKTTEKGGVRGYDKHKNVNGRKRHLVVDTLGLILAVLVHSAGLQDRDGARHLLSLLRFRFPRLILIWADQAYKGPFVEWVKSFCGWVLQIVGGEKGQKGFAVQPHRWIVERTFAWLGKYRRLSKDYEEKTQSSETLIYLTMTHLMLRRLAPP